MIKSFILAALLAASLSFAQVSSIPTAAGGGASTFDNIGSGTNTTATLTCGSGCTLVTTAGVFRLPNGTSAPGTCTVGDAFFDTDATAGLNFYGCTSTNTWTLLGDGGGTTSFTSISDLKVTKTSDTVLTVAAGNFRYLASDGTYTVASLPSATLTVAAGTETADPAVRFSIDENSGSPIIRCIVATSLTSGNYTASGCTKTSANVFPAGNYQLASASISGGVWGTPVDVRTMAGVSNYTVDSTLTKTGKELGVNTAGSFLWGGPHTSDSTYNYCADAGTNDTYACSMSPAITAYVTGGHYFFRANTANTGAATINFNSLGAVPIKKYTSTGGADLADADIRAGAIVEVIYDGTNMQLVNQLGNAGGGGTPGGSSTHVQYNSSGVFAGDSGFVYDSTNKILTLSRSNTSGMASIFRGLNTAGLSLNSGSRVELCHDNSPGTNCLMSEIVYANLDGSNQQWSRIYSYWSALAQTYPLIARKHTEGIVHVGGAANATVGYAAFTASGASRFANAATAGRGLVSIQGAPAELTSQTGNVAARTLLAASHTAGMYRVCGFVAITTAGTGSTAAWTLSWRSPASGTDLTHNLFWSSGAAETDTFSVASANEFNVCKVIRSTGTSAISLDPGDMNTAVYDTAWTVERLR